MIILFLSFCFVLFCFVLFFYVFLFYPIIFFPFYFVFRLFADYYLLSHPYILLFIFCSGFVTDHVFLLQEQSKLYHYLAGFELDAKRKIAMEGRRLEILLPLLSTLNRTAFEALHKQVSFFSYVG